MLLINITFSILVIQDGKVLEVCDMTLCLQSTQMHSNYNLRGYIPCGILDNIIKSIKAKQQKGKATEQLGHPPVPTPKERRQNFGAATFTLVEEENGERKQARKAILSPQAGVKLAATTLLLPVLGLLLSLGSTS